MKKKIFIQLGNSLKHRLAGGLLCCLVLVAAYLFQILFPLLLNNVLILSIYLLIWIALFAGALLWTFREKKAQGLPSQLIDLSYLAAFCLFVADQFYTLLPKEIHEEWQPYFSNYTFLILVIGGLAVAGLIHFSLSLYRKLKKERQESALRAKQFHKLLSSTPPEEKGTILMRKLLENQSIAQLSKDGYAILAKECRRIDPVFSAWLEERNLNYLDRDIVFCVLVRLRKNTDEILTILGLDSGAYRTMKSRARKRLEIEDTDMETFLRNLK